MSLQLQSGHWKTLAKAQRYAHASSAQTAMDKLKLRLQGFYSYIRIENSNSGQA